MFRHSVTFLLSLCMSICNSMQPNRKVMQKHTKLHHASILFSTQICLRCYHPEISRNVSISCYEAIFKEQSTRLHDIRCRARNIRYIYRVYQRKQNARTQKNRSNSERQDRIGHTPAFFPACSQIPNSSHK